MVVFHKQGKGAAEQMAKSEPFITGHDEEGDKQRPGRCLLRFLCAMQQFKRPNWQVFSTGASKKKMEKKVPFTFLF